MVRSLAVSHPFRPAPMRLATFLSLFGLVSLGLFPTGCRERADASAPPPETVIHAATVAVAERPMPRYLTLTGNLQANEASDVAANTSGRIAETFVERGSMVDKGRTVARIDATTAAFSQDEAEATAHASRTQYDVAVSDCMRIDKLYGAGAISKSEYDRQHGACTTAQWQARAAEARLRTAQKMLGDATIRAPFAGMIAERYVTAGEYVRPETKVVRLVAIDPLRLELIVPEADVAQIREGLAVTFHVAAAADQVFHGSIRYVGPAVRPGSRDLIVEAVVPNPDRRLRPGMFATAQVELGEQAVPVIPVAAVRKDGSLNRVFALVSGHAEERLVKLGEERDGVYVVEQGLKKGDQVISPVTDNTVDGAKVE
jgi:membrane fusion protein (multidrug efflux system)